MENVKFDVGFPGICLGLISNNCVASCSLDNVVPSLPKNQRIDKIYRND